MDLILTGRTMDAAGWRAQRFRLQVVPADDCCLTEARALPRPFADVGLGGG